MFDPMSSTANMFLCDEFQSVQHLRNPACFSDTITHKAHYAEGFYYNVSE